MRPRYSIPAEIAKGYLRGKVTKAIAHTPEGAWCVAGGGLFMLLGAGFNAIPQHWENFFRYLLIGLFLVAVSLLTMMQKMPRSQRLLLILAPLTLALGTLWGYGELCQEYAIAMDCMQAGEYDQAVKQFQSLEGFRDSDEKRAECMNYALYTEAAGLLEDSPDAAYRKMFALRGFAPADEMLATPPFQAAREEALAAGEQVTFGSYLQAYTDHSYAEPEPEPIVWDILARDGGRALLISRCALDIRSLHSTKHAVTWADCSLRQWLNNDFLSAAFTAAEQSVIMPTTVSIGDENASVTQDHVYLLSYDELCQYLPQAGERIARATDYASGSARSIHAVSWLLRPTGEPGSSAPCIDILGSLRTVDAAFDPEGIRPVLWVVLDPDFF